MHPPIPAVIKSWIKTDSERGLQRAVLIANALARNGHDRICKDDNQEPSHVTTHQHNGADRSTVFGRIASWGTSLLSTSGDSSDRRYIAFNERSRSKPDHSMQDSRSNIQSESVINQSSHEARIRNWNQTSQVFQSVGMASRLSYLYSAGVEASGNATRAHQIVSHEIKQTSKESIDIDAEDVPEPIGPLPYIEGNVAPDIKTFLLVAQGKFAQQVYVNYDPHTILTSLSLF